MVSLVFCLFFRVLLFRVFRSREVREGPRSRNKKKLTSFLSKKTFRGKPCVCGVSELSVDERSRTASLGGWDFGEGDELTLDGTSGSVIRGAEPLAPPSVTGGGGENGNGENASSGSQLAKFMRWADERRDLRVLANADTPEDAAVARRNGAEG